MNDFVKNNVSNKVTPFIIWTLQRTGGTNLTQQLVARSGLLGTQHEPFNRDRVYSYITKNWLESKDKNALHEEMETVIARRVIIKHCVEMGPWEISAALADATAKDYNHLFLYRKNARDRLLSLHFAQQTGIWGPDIKAKEGHESLDEQAIDVDKLINHERKCVTLMQRIWQYLIDQGAQPLALSYEDIYQAGLANAVMTLSPVLKALQLSNGDDDRLFIEKLIGNGDQGTRSKYEAMLGVAELEAALLNVSSFDVNTDVKHQQ